MIELLELNENKNIILLNLKCSEFNRHMKWKSKVASMYTWLNVHLHLITDFEYFKLFQLVIKDTEKQPKLIGFRVFD